MMDRLLTADEVAALLSVPTTWVYRAARQGELPKLTLGRYVRFDAPRSPGGSPPVRTANQ